MSLNFILDVFGGLIWYTIDVFEILADQRLSDIYVGNRAPEN